MEYFFDFLTNLIFVFGGVTTVFIILLALPKSKLRGVFLKIYGITNISITAILVLYIINPVDLIPDIIPLFGQIDDAAAFIQAIFTGIAGLVAVVVGKNNFKYLNNIKEEGTKIID